MKKEISKAFAEWDESDQSEFRCWRGSRSSLDYGASRRLQCRGPYMHDRRTAAVSFMHLTLGADGLWDAQKGSVGEVDDGIGCLKGRLAHDDGSGG